MGASPLQSCRSSSQDATEEVVVDLLPETLGNAEAVQPDWLVRSYPDEMAVLVSDLSGFTSTTRKHGIVHFASIIARKRQICLPIFHLRGAVHTSFEADNLIALFPNVIDAVKAAVEMREAIATYNASLDDARQLFKIKLNGVGVDCGCGTMIDDSHNILGPAFTGAYHIGEDLCEDGAVLVSDAVKKRVQGDPFFAQVHFKEFKDGEQTCYSLDGQPGPLENAMPVTTEDARYLSPGLLMLAQRHQPRIDLQSLDQKIKAGSMRNLTVLMFSLDLNCSVGGFSQQEGLAVIDLKHRGLALVKALLRQRHGTYLEDMLWTFESPMHGIAAALDLRLALDEINKVLGIGKDEKCKRIEIAGYGLHSGSMLCIEDSDVHWGDGVNTASKLGQDLATDGQILITPLIKSAVEDSIDASLSHLTLEKHNFSRSGLDFECFSVQRELTPTQHQRRLQELKDFLAATSSHKTGQQLAKAKRAFDKAEVNLPNTWDKDADFTANGCCAAAQSNHTLNFRRGNAEYPTLLEKLGHMTRSTSVEK
eukprot:TRINITY_DN33550_c0_g2_i1.p1 TRINITY_DN33550_c0_g2~~TRINITY_DN33550_c0_g2_i1.p1  ORF type:complete len:536 (+),score=105.20 TRINITY_DN33550_c0_g2_i1:92-1699(+)